MKLRVAFIDSAHHVYKTKSVIFFIDILKRWYEVDVVCADLLSGRTLTLDYTAVNTANYDILFILQIIPNSTEMRKFTCKNIVLIPMYDELAHWNDLDWLEYSSYKFLCFAKVIHDKLQRMAMHSFYLQYFPELIAQLPAREQAQPFFFFWQRTADVQWAQLKQLLGTVVPGRFNYHVATDRQFSVVLPTEAEQQAYAVEYSSWFPDRSGFLDILKTADVFFAPRLLEGIGMSFLEAMAYGCCVVAPNAPTMNEYIVHGQTGYLYDPQYPQTLDFDRATLRRLQQNTIQYMQTGKQRYDHCVATQLQPFFEAPVCVSPIALFFAMLKVRGLNLLRKVIR